MSWAPAIPWRRKQTWALSFGGAQFRGAHRQMHRHMYNCRVRGCRKDTIESPEFLRLGGGKACLQEGTFEDLI